jgi:hypothetical protein
MRFGHIKSNGRYKAEFLDTVGDGSGSITSNINGSITPVLFKVTAGVGETLLVNRLLLHLADIGGLDAGAYGNNIVMTNGIELGVMRDGVVILDLTAKLKIKTNADWGAYCYDVTELGFGLGDNYLAVRWTFTKDGAALRLDEGDSFFLKVNDDLTGLTKHHSRLGMLSYQR